MTVFPSNSILTSSLCLFFLSAHGLWLYIHCHRIRCSSWENSCSQRIRHNTTERSGEGRKEEGKEEHKRQRKSVATKRRERKHAATQAGSLSFLFLSFASLQCKRPRQRPTESIVLVRRLGRLSMIEYPTHADEDPHSPAARMARHPPISNPSPIDEEARKTAAKSRKKMKTQEKESGIQRRRQRKDTCKRISRGRHRGGGSEVKHGSGKTKLERQREDNSKYVRRRQRSEERTLNDHVILNDRRWADQRRCGEIPEMNVIITAARTKRAIRTYNSTNMQRTRLKDWKIESRETWSERDCSDGLCVTFLQYLYCFIPSEFPLTNGSITSAGKCWLHRWWP